MLGHTTRGVEVNIAELSVSDIHEPVRPDFARATGKFSDPDWASKQIRYVLAGQLAGIHTDDAPFSEDLLNLGNTIRAVEQHPCT